MDNAKSMMIRSIIFETFFIKTGQSDECKKTNGSITVYYTIYRPSYNFIKYFGEHSIHDVS